MLTPYYAFLLRVWPSAGDVNPGWRLSLEDLHTHRVRGFTDLPALTAYLDELTAQPGESASTPQPAPNDGQRVAS